MGWLQIFRLVALSFAIFCGIIVASLSAHITAFAEENFRVYYVFAALGLATGALTMLTVPVLLIVDFLRTGAFTSYVVVELSWLSVLWVLWIATGALTVNNTTALGVFETCNYIYDWLNQLCHETQAIEAFSFLAWIVLMAYTITLLVVALISANRGKPIWTSSVKQYAPAAAATTQPAYNPNAFAPQTQQQQPLMASTSPPPAQQPLYQQPYQNGSGFQQQHPPQPIPSPASVPSQASYPTQPSYPQV